jgi:4-hydroxy-3-polyprenylbenzoate decarboxylase
MGAIEQSAGAPALDRAMDAGPSMRSWLAQLEAAGELRRIGAEVDWDLELGGIARINIAQRGPALLFENIKDYRDTLCRRFMTCGISNSRQVALLLGLPAATSSQALVRHLKQLYRKPIAPVQVATGPVKEQVLTGDAIDLNELIAPRWHQLDGGRYIDTFAGVVTVDPETGQQNVGVYRGQLLGRDRIGKLLVRTQGWGQHFLKYGMKPAPMPVAIVYGWHDVLPFCGSSCFPRNVNEWDMMGAILGRPVELVKCETNDLLVPASAEIVVEGYVDVDPKTFEPEGPFSEYPGYAGGSPSPKPVVKATAISCRRDPIMRGALEGARPGFPSEDVATFAHSWSAIAWNLLEDLGVTGVTDVWIPPVTTCTHIIVQIHKNYRGHAQQVAAALWGWSMAQFAFKHVIVVEEDIDIRDPEAVEWAIAYRVNAGEDGITFYGPTYGSPIDPSTRHELRNPAKYGSGKWTRVLIDATRNWEFEANPAYGGRRFPPIAKMPVDLERKIAGRWREYGIGVPYLDEAQREQLTLEQMSKRLPEV